jgi:hypothetical protein
LQACALSLTPLTVAWRSIEPPTRLTRTADTIEHLYSQLRDWRLWSAEALDFSEEPCTSAMLSTLPRSALTARVLRSRSIPITRKVASVKHSVLSLR